MNHGLRRLPDLPVSIRLIREIHGVLMEGMRGGNLTPGELRRSQNWIGPAGSTINTATFVPPPPDMLLDTLGALESFLHANDDVPPLIRIALAHVQFETIHPFLDGNGRVGRLLITFLLTERAILHKPVLYLSHYFKQHRQQYYDLLNGVRNEGGWEAWIRFFLTGVVQVSAEAAETARRILELREQHRSAITERLGRGAANGHKVLESLYERPIVTVTDVQKRTGTTYAAANMLVRKLVEIGVLAEMTGFTRNRRFRYDPYVRLFTEDVPEVRAGV
jgi:Fic family protein